MGFVHKGFWQALNLVWSDLLEGLKKFRKNNQTLWLTGHSLGAALAALMTARLLEEGQMVNGLYNFGQPRVGNSAFVEKFNAIMRRRSFRFVNNLDIVTRVPPRVMEYSDTDTCCYFDDNGKLHKGITWWGKFLKELVQYGSNAIDRYNFLWTLAPEWVNDHDMTRYVELVKGIQNL